MAVKKVIEMEPVQPQKSMMEKFGPVLVVLVVAMAFALGSLWSKVKYLEKGGSPSAGDPAGAQQAAGGKFKKLGDALRAYAKEAGLDGNKLMSCVDGGEKSDVVEADYQQGAAVGVQGTPGFFVNGRFLGGAFPFEAFKELVDRELAGTGSNNYLDYKDTNLQGAGAGAQPAFIATPKTVEVGESAVKGGSNAKVTIVEFSDFQCPFCERGYRTLGQIQSAYGDQVRIVYKNFPLREIHPLAQKTAEAFECAREQDQTKAWKLHDVMFEKQQEWASTTI